MPAEILYGTQDLHVWEAGGAASAEALAAWVSARLAAHEAALAALLAVEGERTPENSLRHFDAAIEQLNLAGAQAGMLNSVAADKAVRDQAQMKRNAWRWRQRAEPESRGVRRAGGDQPGRRERATKHYVERTLLGYRLAGVDKDEATRDRLQALHEKATQLSLEFSRNIQEGGKTIEASPGNWMGCLPITLRGIQRKREKRHGASEAHHRSAGHDAGNDFRSQRRTSQEDVSGLQHPRLSGEPADTARSAGYAAGDCEHSRLPQLGRSGDCRPDDGVGGERAQFLARLDEASREGARNEHAQVLEFVRQRQPELAEIDITSRGYWYEQFRRTKYDFDSQSVRPYFPYVRVEAGVLETAAKLFKVEFRPSRAGVAESVSVFEVLDGARLVGRFYLDMHPREGKNKWFSAAPVVTGVRGRVLPEAALICNFPAGEDDPGLLQYSDVVTFFHEFGHLMHAILGGQTEWVGLSGFATEGDFIEVPSQMLEEFFRDEKLLQAFAKHYETGETLPSELIRKMKLAGALAAPTGCERSFTTPRSRSTCTIRTRRASILTR